MSYLKTNLFYKSSKNIQYISTHAYCLGKPDQSPEPRDIKFTIIENRENTSTILVQYLKCLNIVGEQPH